MQQLQRDTAAQVMQLLDEEQAAALKKQIDARQNRGNAVPTFPSPPIG